jgi:hypothetical protein
VSSIACSSTSCGLHHIGLFPYTTQEHRLFHQGHMGRRESGFLFAEAYESFLHVRRVPLASHKQPMYQTPMEEAR